MTKNKIKEVAIEHFKKFGYHGARMAQIAEEAGIRKQTLAYHYPSKMKLFEELYRDVVEEEISFVCSFFLSNTELDWEGQLYQFLIQHKDRFLNNANANFMFITSFIPPMEAYNSVIVEYRRYLGILKEQASQLFTQDHRLRLTPEECMQAYVTLLDGLDVQLVYEDTSLYEQLLKNGWNVFIHGVR